MSRTIEKCLTRDELAQVLGVSRRTVQRMDKNGTGPKPMKIGHRTVRYAVREVSAFLEKNGDRK